MSHYLKTEDDSGQDPAPKQSLAQSLSQQKESERRRSHWTGSQPEKQTAVIESVIPENETIDEKIARLIAELRSKNATK